MPTPSIVFVLGENHATVERETHLIEQGLDGLEYSMTVVECGNASDAIRAVADADIVLNLGVPMPRDVIHRMDGTAAIICQAQGFDHIDVDAATETGIMVVNSAAYCADEVAIHTMMLLVACARKLTYLHDLTRSGGWDETTRSKLFDIPPVYGQTLGIVGLGNIGRLVTRKAKAFDLNVVAYDPYIPPWIARENRVRLASSLENLASESDFVVVLTPSGDQTRKLIGPSFFSAMKPTAFFINVSRGSTVDEAALIEALLSGEIAGAGLDVFEQEPVAPDNPLLGMDNVVVSPHSAGTSSMTAAAGQKRIGEEAARILKGTWPMSLVNPAVRSRLTPRPPATNT
jgi:D-3-phosphoglycerate dehydrogenase